MLPQTFDAPGGVRALALCLREVPKTLRLLADAASELGHLLGGAHPAGGHRIRHGASGRSIG